MAPSKSSLAIDSPTPSPAKGRIVARPMGSHSGSLAPHSAMIQTCFVFGSDLRRGCVKTGATFAAILPLSVRRHSLPDLRRGMPGQVTLLCTLGT
eukprot:1891907-Amphidinium_carterae.1